MQVAPAQARGEDVEEAVTQALGDRNPMVREVAEMVEGRPLDDQ